LLAADQGGFYPRTWPWAALAFGAVAALILLATPGLRIPRSGIVLVGGLALLCAWTAISAQWSLEPSSSLREAERTLVYVAAALALVLLAAAVGATPLLLGLATAAVATACYSLVERAVRGPHLADQQASLLERPLGYANALGALCAIGLVVVLTRRPRAHTGRLIARYAVHRPRAGAHVEPRLRRRCGCRARRRGCTACGWPALGGRGSSAGSRDARRRRRRRSCCAA
jgi:hypothetical protein